MKNSCINLNARRGSMLPARNNSPTSLQFSAPLIVDSIAIAAIVLRINIKNPMERFGTIYDDLWIYT